eukprot:gene8523-11520_t
MRHSLIQSILLFILCVGFHYCEIDESLIAKDLYQVLGIRPPSTTKDIKKAYRNLAKIHHPDKAKGSKRDVHEKVFREIAEAYEILSSSERKEEYDAARKRYLEEKNRKSYDRRNDNNRQTNSNHRDSQKKHSMDDNDYGSFVFDAMEEMFRQTQEQFASYFNPRPVMVGPVIAAGQVIYPCNPIMTSSNGLFFSFLDNQCSLGVYKGDVNLFIDKLIHSHNRQVDLSSLPIEILFRSEGNHRLNGNCFAGLDESGLLQVYAGNPNIMNDYYPIWSSKSSWDSGRDTVYDMYFSRYYLELANNGELAVRQVTTGEQEVKCIWSTTSCNKYLAMLRDVKSTLTSHMQDLSGHLNSILQHLTKRLSDLLDWVKEQNFESLSQELISSLKSSFDHGVYKIRSGEWMDEIKDFLHYSKVTIELWKEKLLGNNPYQRNKNKRRRKYN